MKPSERELPLERQLELEQIKRYVAELEDVEKIKTLLINEVEDRLLLRHYCELLMEQLNTYKTLIEEINS